MKDICEFIELSLHLFFMFYSFFPNYTLKIHNKDKDTLNLNVGFVIYSVTLSSLFENYKPQLSNL